MRTCQFASVNGHSSDLQCDLSCLVMDRHVGLHPEQNYIYDLLVSPMYVHMYNLPKPQSMSLKRHLRKT